MESLPIAQPATMVEFLEALYRWEASEEDWLHGLCAPILRMFPTGMWVQANTFDVSDDTFKCPTLVTHQAPPVVREAFQEQSTHFTPEVIARCYRASSVSTFHTLPETVERETGARGVVAVKGLDPSGRSAALNVGLREGRSLSASAVELLRRMAGHIASAARVRRRIAAGASDFIAPTSGADAVFSPEQGGRLLHAEAAAKGREQREQLTGAVRLREATRVRRQREASLGAWRPLVDTRWTLVDTYESNGSRYIVARENHAEVRSLETLTERERQVVVCLAFGQTTKEIAYDLGIDASTVRVLLQRAATKLAVGGRAGLLDHPAVKAMRGDIDAGELRRIRAAEGVAR